MPRKLRVVLPNQPHHVVQRGHDRRAVFATAQDYLYYLDNLRECKGELRSKVFAFCLMTNHVHLIIDPGEQPENLGRLMKRLAARQTRLVNKLEGRTGTLWESRYKSSPIDTEAYLLTCSAYVELNPVRAGLVTHPDEYPWSSYGHKVGKSTLPWLDVDPCYEFLGRTPATRAQAYRHLLEAEITEEQLALIRQSVQRGQLTGGERFGREIAERLGRRIPGRGPGRPRAQQAGDGRE